MKKNLMIVALALTASLCTLNAADAKDNYEKLCAKCHGADGKGDTKMGKKLNIKDYTDAKVQAAYKDEEAVKAIKEGLKEKDSDKTLMKAFADLSDDEIKALVKLMRDFKAK